MSDYRANATACLNALLKWYNTDTGLWETMGWWNAANALEAIIDFSILNSTNQALPIIINSFDKLKETKFLRPWYDDEGWWALTWIKAFDHTNNGDYLAMSQSIFDDIAKGWDEGACGGGVWWHKPGEYKNAITNELFLTLAARLYIRTLDENYLHWVKRELDWFFGSGMLNEQTLINDGLDNNCQNNHGTTWTYNQGVILGGLVDVVKCLGYDVAREILGDIAGSSLERAQSIANAAISTLIDKNGVLSEPCEAHGNCDGNQSLFKGIFMRNLGYLALALNSEPVPPASLDRYKQFILHNADNLWANCRTEDNTFGLCWSGPIDTPDASRQAAALDCLNAAMAIGSQDATPQPLSSSPG